MTKDEGRMRKSEKTRRAPNHEVRDGLSLSNQTTSRARCGWVGRGVKKSPAPEIRRVLIGGAAGNDFDHGPAVARSFRHEARKIQRMRDLHGVLNRRREFFAGLN